MKGDSVAVSNGYDGLFDGSLGVKISPSIESECYKGKLLSSSQTVLPNSRTSENSKHVKGDDFPSTNAPFTLEDFFTGYDDGNINDTVDDVFETDLDFSKLSGVCDDISVDTSFEPLIDLVKCESWVDDFSRTLLNKSELLNVPLDTLVRKTKPKVKSRRVDSYKGPIMNDRKADYGANDTIDNICDLEWHPGFTRHLGAKGRSALLELVRRVYRQDPNHYKAILQSRNPPSSISNLPFFSIPMLWELTHQFGIFKDALLVYKNNCFSKAKNKRQSDGNNASSVTSMRTSPKQEPVGIVRSAKRPKKHIDYSSIVRNSDGIVESSKDEDVSNMDDNLQMQRISSNTGIKDEIAFKLLDNDEKKDENEVEKPYLWKLAMVPNRRNNCFNYSDERIINNNLNRRISV